jgi:3',5'-cyclic AMP phosphodiesterase CpdA
MLIAQISDTHIKTDGRLAYGVVDTAAMLERCVQQLMNQGPSPDAVIVTGDLVDFGKPAEYALLKRLLEPIHVPLYLLAGNHDDREELRRAFAEPGFDHLREHPEFVQYTASLGGLRLVALDTVIPHEGGGRLCAQRLAWLDEQLGNDPSPTIVAMHHPPFLTGIAHMDVLGLDGRDAFTEVIARHEHVQRVLCGHLHRSIQVRLAHTVAQTCPSPAHQVALDLSPGGPDCFVMEPPGYLLHRWADGTLVTHTCVVGSFDGPYRFREGGELID